jgi:hypothetical protein
VRAYLTGFGEPALEDFQAIEGGARYAYRCSAHCPLDEVPEILQAIAPAGRLYATLCEFQTQQLLLGGEDASVIIGVMGMEACVSTCHGRATVTAAQESQATRPDLHAYPRLLVSSRDG